MFLRVTWVVIFILENAACRQLLLRPISAVRTTTLSDAEELMSELAELYPTTTTVARQEKSTKSVLKSTVPVIFSTDAETKPSIDGNDEDDEDGQQGAPQGGGGNREKEHRDKGGGKKKGDRGQTAGQRKPYKGKGSISQQNHRLEKINLQGNKTEGSTVNDRGPSHTEKFDEWGDYHTQGYSPQFGNGRDSFSHKANEADSSNSVIRNEKFTEEIDSLTQAAKSLVDQSEEMKNLIIIVIVLQILLTIAGVGVIVWLIHMKFEQLYMAVEIVPETYEPRGLNVR